MEKNFGLVLVNPPVTQWIFGGVSGITGRAVRRPDHDWSPFLTAYEPQSFNGYDTFGCVTFSGLNNVEISMKERFGKEYNWSDRFTAKMSGTTNTGNTFFNVAESIRNDGLVPQERYTNNAPTREAFYQEVPSDLVEEGKKFATSNKISYEFVPYYPESIWDALQYGPVQVAGFAWTSRDVNGHFVRTDRYPNHGFTVYGGRFKDVFYAFDHYNVFGGDGGKKALNWNYRFWAALMYEVESFNEEYMNFEEGVLYQLVTPPGGFYLMAAGKLRRDELSKLLASHLVRNDGKIEGKVGTITGDDLENVKVYDLKGEEVDKW